MIYEVKAGCGNVVSSNVKNFDVCASMKKKFALVVRKDLSAKQDQLQNANALVSN